MVSGKYHLMVKIDDGYVKIVWTDVLKLSQLNKGESYGRTKRT
jgi:hypothetical protein